MKVIKRGKKYRQLYGVEFYFVPSLKDWQIQFSEHQDAVKAAKSSKIAEALATEEKIIAPAGEDEEAGGHVIENESETKEAKGNKPEWKRYYHLVAIAQNRKGLSNLFTLVKKSFKYGFYRFPRIDFEMLKEHGEGLILSTACVGGIASGLIYKEFPDIKFSDLHPDLLTGPNGDSFSRNIGGRLDNMIDRFVDCVGRDNFFLELQFNELSAQHLTNKCLIDASLRNGIPLISTADSHFPSPDKWQARELYKKLGWIGSNLEGQKLPSREEMKTLLYPKNSFQMWEEFKSGWEKYPFYRGYENLVKESIERTHDIAWQKCEDTWIDTSAKLPKFDRPDETAFQRLAKLCRDAMITEGLHEKPEYLERIKEELSDVKFLKFENYFLTLYEIFKEAEKETLLGCARGSGGGSLINYLLKITQVDPVEHKLMWARFLGRHRCLEENTFVLAESGPKMMKDLLLGEKVMTHDGTFKAVIDKSGASHNKAAKIKFGDQTIICSLNHRWIVLRGEKEIEIMACELQKSDGLIKLSREIIKIDDIEFVDFDGLMVDIEVEDNHTFFISDTEGGNYVLTHNTSWPDVDSDASNRDVFINVAKKLFGDDSVVPVSNFNTLQLKSLIKDISKFYGISFEEVNAMTGPLIDEVMSQAKDENMEKGLFVLLHEDCMKYSKGYRDFMEKYPEVHEHVATLFKQNRSIGRHAGGVLIAPPELLEQTMPVISVRGELQTPWSEGVNFRHLEDNGFLKFDFLGLALMRDVENCIRKILKKKNGVDPHFLEIKEFFDKSLNCRFVKADDQKVWEYIYHQRRKVGIFQFTEEGARKFCEESRPKNITELAAITSIFRPGPLKAGVHKQWVEIVSGRVKPTYDHPIIKEVLEETHGFMCLAGDSLVQTEEGLIPIKDIVDNKFVTNLPSYNVESGEIEIDRVTQFYDHGPKETIVIETEDGEITLTPDHKIYTTRGIIQAQDLKIDDEIISIN
jgi:DNA polymerase III alpha subunit